MSNGRETHKQTLYYTENCFLKIETRYLCWTAANSTYYTNDNGIRASIRAFMGSQEMHV